MNWFDRILLFKICKHPLAFYLKFARVIGSDMQSDGHAALVVSFCAHVTAGIKSNPEQDG